MSGTVTYEAVAADVLAWATREFPTATVYSAATHLGDKAEEVGEETDVMDQDGGEIVWPDAARKVVSCALILVHLAALAGIEDLPAAMAAKLEEDKASTFRHDPVLGYARRLKA